MLNHLTWVPYWTPIIVAGFPISGIYLLNQQSGGTSPAFALPTSPDFSNYSAEWTPPRQRNFLQWWSTGRQAGPDDQSTEFFIRTAFANWETRLLASDRDGRLLDLMAQLQQRHQNLFLRTGLSQKLNQVAQFCAYGLGVEHHLGLKGLQSLAGMSWGKVEINLMLTGCFRAGVYLDEESAILAVWAALNAEEHTSAAGVWRTLKTKFISQFKRLHPSGFVLQRPTVRTEFHYEPSHPDVRGLLDPSINLGLEMYDFYADSQLSGITGVFRSLLTELQTGTEKKELHQASAGTLTSTLTDSEKARLFFTKVSKDANKDRALDVLRKLCGWDIMRTREAFGIALYLWSRQYEGLQHPSDVPDWLKARLFMQAQDGITMRKQLPIDLAIVCGWDDPERAAKAIEEASRKSGLDLTAGYPLCW